MTDKVDHTFTAAPPIEQLAKMYDCVEESPGNWYRFNSRLDARDFANAIWMQHNKIGNLHHQSNTIFVTPSNRAAS
jgi:hypothetical protein